MLPTVVPAVTHLGGQRHRPQDSQQDEDHLLDRGDPVAAALPAVMRQAVAVEGWEEDALARGGPLARELGQHADALRPAISGLNASRTWPIRLLIG